MCGEAGIHYELVVHSLYPHIIHLQAGLITRGRHSMNKQESLELFAKGRGAWNKWAEERLAERKELEEASLSLSSPESRMRKWRNQASVDFSGHLFERDVDFTKFIFPGEADFGSSKFEGNAFFGKAKLCGDTIFKEVVFDKLANFDQVVIDEQINFVESTFNSEAKFNKSIFNAMVWFAGANFNDHTNFEGAVFHELAYFKDVSFSGVAYFQNSSFRDVDFTDAKFLAVSWFYDSEFNGNTLFNQSVFKGPVNFSQASFYSFTTFHKTQFYGATTFNAIRSERTFTLEEARFNLVPDFIQGHFEEAPRLDNIVVPKSRFLSSDYGKNFANMSALWRALKRLAIQGHDHERELQFFAEEIRAQQTWTGFLYEVLSDFGRSLWLPFIWWCGINGFMTLAHFLTSSLSRPSTNALDTFFAAAHLAFTKGLLVLGWGASDKLVDDYRLLYGGAKSVTKDVTAPSIPYIIDVMQMGQAIFSAVLIFLFLLALRNRFRIN